MMTYSELLHQVSFEDIIPYFEPHLLYGYKQHYDMLKQLEPIAADDDYEGHQTIEIDRAPTAEGGLLQTHSLNNEPWQYSLANRIILAEGVKAPLAEIAACCLFSSSHYGFVENYIDVPTHECMWMWVDIYNRGALFDKFSGPYDSYFRRSWIRKTKAYRDSLKRQMKRLDEINAIGSKRHLWKRVSMRNAYLEVATVLSAYVNYVTQGNHLVAPPSAKELCSGLFKSYRQSLDTLWSFADDASHRVAYLQDLVQKYGALDGARLGNVIVCITTSAAHPLEANEQEAIAALFDDRKTNVVWCVKHDDRVKEAVRIDYAFYE